VQNWLPAIAASPPLRLSLAEWVKNTRDLVYTTEGVNYGCATIWTKQYCRATYFGTGT
jgi:hypothetical protein